MQDGPTLLKANFTRVWTVWAQYMGARFHSTKALLSKVGLGI